MSHYPLREVLIIKKRKLDEAEKVLKEKKEILLKEEEKLAHIFKEYEKVKSVKDAKLQQLRETLDSETTSSKIQQMKEYLKIIEAELKQKQIKLDEQKKVVDQAKKNVELAREDFIKKQMEVEKLRHHKEEWSKEALKEEERKESLEGDDISSSRHVRKKKSSSKDKNP